MSQNPPVIHRNVALMLCDSSAVLTETLHQLETEDIPFKRVGDRGFVAPAYFVDKIRQRLKDKAIYPAIIGEIITQSGSDDAELVDDLDELDEDDSLETNSRKNSEEE